MLKKFIRKFRYGQKGFTLIELLVVIAILGVLAAVVVPNISKFIGSGKIEALNTEADIVRTAITAYAAEHGGTYPASGDTSANGIGPYLSKSPEATYEWDTTTGAITGASGVSGYSFNASTGKWEKQ